MLQLYRLAGVCEQGFFKISCIRRKKVRDRDCRQGLVVGRKDGRLKSSYCTRDLNGVEEVLDKTNRLGTRQHICSLAGTSRIHRKS